MVDWQKVTAVGVWALVVLLAAGGAGWALLYIHIWQGGCDPELQEATGVAQPTACQPVDPESKTYAMEPVNETPPTAPEPGRPP